MLEGLQPTEPGIVSEIEWRKGYPALRLWLEGEPDRWSVVISDGLFHEVGVVGDLRWATVDEDPTEAERLEMAVENLQVAVGFLHQRPDIVLQPSGARSVAVQVDDRVVVLQEQVGCLQSIAGNLAHGLRALFSRTTA